MKRLINSAALKSRASIRGYHSKVKRQGEGVCQVITGKTKINCIKNCEWGKDKFIKKWAEDMNRQGKHE